MNKKISVWIFIAVWVSLILLGWLLPDAAVSDSERRPLSQMPGITVKNLWDGRFMAEFEDYTLDQFPLRDGFRTVKSLFHYYILGQKDNNGIYLTQGHAVKQEYPLNEASLTHVTGRFQHLYEKYLEESQGRIYFAAVPDKSFYLAEQAGQPVMDYEAMFANLQETMPWTKWIDLREHLSAEDYYRTDTHWRQEQLLPAAEAICEAMGIQAPGKEDYTSASWEPFYGVYYGQAALPMEPDTVSWLQSDLLASCTVYDHETGKTGGIYDLEKLQGKDPYEVFLSGPKPLLTIDNPAGQPGKELIIFRDSFGSALAPLLVQGYEKVTLVDIRYLQIDVLDRFMEFKGQDVLFLYSTLILNNSSTIK